MTDPHGLPRRQVLGWSLAAALAPRFAAAQDLSAKPIRLVVGTPPGGSIDTAARTIAQPLGEALQTTVLVENKPGASGVLSSDFVAKAAPDGYTLLVGTPSPVVVAPQAMAKPPLNPLTDLIGVNMVSTTYFAIALNPRVPAKSLKELVALSKTRPITMGLPLAGSASHIVVEMIAKATGCNFLNVPYKGAAPANNDTIAGHVDSTVSDVSVFVPLHKDGRLRILLVTSEKRLDDLPDVPTLSEDVPGMVMANWIGLFAPGRTPRPVVDRISAAIQRVAARDDVRAQFRRSLVTATSMARPEDFQRFVNSEYDRYGQLVRERHITID